MPEQDKASRSIDIWSYNNLDGSNSTQALCTVKYTFSKNLSFSVGGGPMTNCKDNSGLIWENKVNFKPVNNITLQLRDKHVWSKKSDTEQLRLSGEISHKIGKNTTVYGTVYGAAKRDNIMDSWTTDNGIFAGATHSLGSGWTGKIEGQRYSLIGGQNVKANWGINVGLSKSLH